MYMKKFFIIFAFIFLVFPNISKAEVLLGQLSGDSLLGYQDQFLHYFDKDEDFQQHVKGVESISMKIKHGNPKQTPWFYSSWFSRPRFYLFPYGSTSRNDLVIKSALNCVEIPSYYGFGEVVKWEVDFSEIPDGYYLYAIAMVGFPEPGCSIGGESYDNLVFVYGDHGDTLPLDGTRHFNYPGIPEDGYLLIEGQKTSGENAPDYSSVLFLPGHQSSRLYNINRDGNEDQLWEPTNHNEDVRQLFLYPDGTSIDHNVYTKEIVDEVYGASDNIYKSFVESMDNLVVDNVIKEWKPIPYDWRLPLEEIVYRGVEMENNKHIDIIEEIKRMATNSDTGRVTIVGHSNGGLLAKVLINRLKEINDENLIDKLIMVGTPQLGTPKAIAALLHGDEANLLYGAILDKKTGRQFAENMVSIYNLLPSQEYFNIVQSPVIEFDKDVENIYDFHGIYGKGIDSFDEFERFLLGDNGMRFKPAFDDLDSPNVLWGHILEWANETHNRLDSWQAPEDIEVIQIAGWGLDTISGIKYDDCDILFCPDNLDNLDRSLILSQDGDATVVVPSAIQMSGAEKYYLNIKEYNNKERIITNEKHSSILEIEPLLDFIRNIIQNNRELTEYIYQEKPEVKDEDRRLRFRLHSPLSVNIYDEYRNHTGLVENTNPNSDLKFYEEKIPNSYYIEFGETKYLGAGTDSPIEVELIGEDLGIFTFEVDEVSGNETVTTTFANIPVVKGMKVRLLVSDSVSEMEIDIGNDGQVDMVFQPRGEIKTEDLFEIFIKIINSLEIDNSVKNKLVKKIESAKKQAKKDHYTSANAILENVKQQIEVFSSKSIPKKLRIVKSEAEKLIKIVNNLIK